LARQGFNVFVADLRGRGQSTPSLKEEAKAGGARHGQLEYIRDDIPKMVEAVQQIAEQQKLHCVAHSWGGVLFASAMGRTPAVADAVASQVYVASKRFISVFNW
jgi:alpha-beta hydrolase superfamily lysophospholipase